MKKFVTGLTLVLALASCTQTKIAYVDVEEVLKEYEGSKKAEEELNAQSEQMSIELDQLAMPFQQKVQEYQQNSQSMSASARQEKEQELMREQQMLQQRQQMAQQQVQAESQKKMDEINEEIESFLESYAKSKGYSYILGTSMQTRSVLYGEESLDITDDVIEALNADFGTADTEEATEQMQEPDTVN